MTTSTTTRFKKENDALVEELEIKKELGEMSKPVLRLSQRYNFRQPKNSLAQ